MGLDSQIYALPCAGDQARHAGFGRQFCFPGSATSLQRPNPIRAAQRGCAAGGRCTWASQFRAEAFFGLSWVSFFAYRLENSPGSQFACSSFRSLFLVVQAFGLTLTLPLIRVCFCAAGVVMRRVGANFGQRENDSLEA